MNIYSSFTCTVYKTFVVISLLTCLFAVLQVDGKAPFSDTSDKPHPDAGKKLDRPDPKPESQGASKVSEKCGEGKVRDVVLCDGYLRVERKQDI